MSRIAAVIAVGAAAFVTFHARRAEGRPSRADLLKRGAPHRHPH